MNRSHNMRKPRFLTGSSSLGEVVAEKLVAGVAFVSFAFIILILIFIFREAFPLFLGTAIDEIGHVSLIKLFSTSWQPVSNTPQYGLLPIIIGSAKVTFVAVVIAAPIAILAALYTTAFAPRWAKEIMKPCIEILAGFPSVVIGFFALTVLASAIQSVFGLDYRLNAFTGGLAPSFPLSSPSPKIR
jgi:phosphate transport system permease protein